LQDLYEQLRKSATPSARNDKEAGNVSQSYERVHVIDRALWLGLKSEPEIGNGSF